MPAVRPPSAGPFPNAVPAAPAMRGVVGGGEKEPNPPPWSSCAPRSRPMVALGAGRWERGGSGKTVTEVLSAASSFQFTITPLIVCLVDRSGSTRGGTPSTSSSFPFTITSRCTCAQCPDRTILRLRARDPPCRLVSPLCLRTVPSSLRMYRATRSTKIG